MVMVVIPGNQMKFYCFILFFVGCVCGANAQIAADSLALYLPFEGNANDVSGNNYNGVVSGATLTTGVSNKPNTAYYFDGSSSITIPNAPKLDSALTQFTVLIRLMPQNIYGPGNPSYTFLTWQKSKVYAANPMAGIRLIMGWEPPGPGTQSNASFMDYIMEWCSANVSTASGYQLDSAKVNNTWMTVALVYDEGTIKVYHNCNKVLNWINVYPHVSDLCITNSTSIVLGNALPEITQYGYRNFIGKIDELRIYTRALSESEVMYFADSTCKELPVIAPALNYYINPCQPNEVILTDTSTVTGTHIDSRLWKIDNGDTASAKQFVYRFAHPGRYKVQLNLYAAGNTYTVDTTINILSVNTVHFLPAGQDTVKACAGSVFQVNIPGGASYAWLPCINLSNCSSASPVIKADTDITYTITAKDINNCADTTHITVKRIPDENKVFAPTAFTPNGDGQNDAWGITSEKPLADFKLRLFNRWGQNIFLSEDQYHKWNGTVKNLPAMPGTYVWLLQYKNSTGCSNRTAKGTVLLIR
jgi:gliding motility-associated-like protein